MNQYYAVATFHVLGSKDEYDYVYVTYDKGKLKGIEINKMGSYNILARTRIPIDKNAFVDMRLFTGKDDKIKEFTMQYRDLVNYNGVLLIMDMVQRIRRLKLNYLTRLEKRKR